MDNNPQLPPPDQLDDEFFNQFIFDASKDYPDSMYLFQYKEVKFSPFGGIQAITGQKKNGKTFFLEMLTAAALEPDSERVKSRLQGLRVNPEAIKLKEHPLTVMYVDTEQELLNTSRFTKGVNWLCDWPTLSNHPRFRIIRLRKIPDGYDTPTTRLKAVLHFIPKWEPDIVIIDGIRDLVHDFNDNAESVNIINRLMSLAEERNIAIWNALHYNPRPGADGQSKMRGHLGTELGNKVTDTFVSSKKKDEVTGIVSFTAKQTDARAKDVPDIHFEVTTERDGAIEIAVPRITDIDEEARLKAAERKIADKQKVEQLKQWIEAYRDKIDWPAKHSDFRHILLGDYAGVTDEGEQKKLVDVALRNNLLIKQVREEMPSNQKVPRLKLNENIFAPF